MTMTIREVEEKILNHLDTQGAPARATDSYGGCRYRTEEGLKCAAGCLISDDLYKDCFEGVVVSRKSYTRAPDAANIEDQIWESLVKAGVPDTDRAAWIVRQWQIRHDDSENWDETGYIGPRDFIGN